MDQDQALAEIEPNPNGSNEPVWDDWVPQDPAPEGDDDHGVEPELIELFTALEAQEAGML